MSTAIVGVSSYISHAEATSIAADRLFAAAWNGATEEAQHRALITATSILDSMRWQGCPVDPDQPLAWPRQPFRFAGSGIEVTADIVPPIRTACADLAIYLLERGSMPGGPAVMQRMLGDSMTMHFAHVADELPPHVRRLVAPYLTSPSAHCAEVIF